MICSYIILHCLEYIFCHACMLSFVNKNFKKPYKFCIMWYFLKRNLLKEVANIYFISLQTRCAGVCDSVSDSQGCFYKNKSSHKPTSSTVHHLVGNPGY